MLFFAPTISILPIYLLNCKCTFCEKGCPKAIYWPRMLVIQPQTTEITQISGIIYNERVQNVRFMFTMFFNQIHVKRGV